MRTESREHSQDKKILGTGSRYYSHGKKILGTKSRDNSQGKNPPRVGVKEPFINTMSHRESFPRGSFLY